MRILYVIGFFLLTTSFSASSSWISQAVLVVSSFFRSTPRSPLWDIGEFNRKAKLVESEVQLKGSVQDEEGNKWTSSGITLKCKTPSGSEYVRSFHVRSNMCNNKRRHDVEGGFRAIRDRSYKEVSFNHLGLTDEELSLVMSSCIHGNGAGGGRERKED